MSALQIRSHAGGSDEEMVGASKIGLLFVLIEIFEQWLTQNLREYRRGRQEPKDGVAQQQRTLIDKIRLIAIYV